MIKTILYKVIIKKIKFIEYVFHGRGSKHYALCRL